MKRFLIKFAANAAEREGEKLTFTNLVIFFFPLLAIILCVVFSLSPWWIVGLSVFAGAWYLFLYLAGIINGNVKGAKYALQNPRRGETWVEIKDGEEVVWSSEKFIPLPAMPGVLEVDTKPKINLPKEYNTWVKWRKVYSIVAPLKAQGELTEKEILAHTKDFIDNLKTLRHIEKAGETGYLDTWEKFSEMTGRKNE